MRSVRRLRAVVAAGCGLAAAFGLSVAAAAQPAAAKNPRVAIILLDINVSPTTSVRLQAERQQALAYARALPGDVMAGLITFADSWHPVLAPTRSRSAFAAAVAAVNSAGATSHGLVPALAAAVAELRRLGASKQSRLLVLSNAERLRPPVPAVAVPVDIVTSHFDGDDYPNLIRALAIQTGGHLASPAGVGQLAALFGPPPPVSPSPTPTQSSRPAAASPAFSGWHLTTSLEAVLGIVFIAFLLLAIVALRSVRPGNRRPGLAAQIGQYGPTSAAVSAAKSAQNAPGRVALAAVGLMRQLLSSRSAEPKLARRLDQAGIRRQPAEWALLGVCASVGLAAAFAVLFGNVAVGVLLGVGAGWAVMRLLLDFKIRRRRAAFDDQLPNVLQLIAGSIQSGFSLAQAIDGVVREDAQPASGEFARVIAENRLGIDLADGLDSVAARMESADLRWVVMAIRIQRETGGNLSEVLRNTVTTMRERGYLRRQVRSLSAEGRLSAYILIALPILIGAWLFYSSASYMRPLYATVIGLIMLSGAVALVIVGAIWMRKLIKVEV